MKILRMLPMIGILLLSSPLSQANDYADSVWRGVAIMAAGTVLGPALFGKHDIAVNSMKGAAIAGLINTTISIVTKKDSGKKSDLAAQVASQLATAALAGALNQKIYK